MSKHTIGNIHNCENLVQTILDVLDTYSAAPKGKKHDAWDKSEKKLIDDYEMPLEVRNAIYMYVLIPSSSTNKTRNQLLIDLFAKNDNLKCFLKNEFDCLSENSDHFSDTTIKNAKMKYKDSAVEFLANNYLGLINTL